MEATVRVDEQDVTTWYWPHGRELAAIAAFWTLFAVLSVMNWMFPPTGEGPPMTARVIIIGGVEAVLWMIATPPIFWLTSRFSIERRGRSSRILFYVAVALVIAVAIDLSVELTREHFLPPPPGMRDGRRPEDAFWGFARTHFLNDYMVCLAVLAAGIARDYVARYQRRVEEAARLRTQLAEARLAMLQSQLNPHFLFNTLNAVSALVDIDPRGVRRMIARLSELLRATLEPNTDPEAPVAREIAMLERYLEILRIRFQGRLETSIDVGSSVQDALMPPMILQPLVENAMKHAVSKTSGQSRIDVAVQRQEESLVLTVRDTGSGSRDARDIASNGTEGSGIGLRNTRARLAGIYGDDFALDLDRTENGGTTVTVRLPYHTAADLRAVPIAGESLQ